MKIMVVGAGMMGAGITQVFAQSDFPVIMVDLNKDIIAKGIYNIEKALDRNINKGIITVDEKNDILQRIEISTDLNEGKNVDFVIEVVTENEKVKKEVFQKLDRVCKPEAI